MPSFIAAHMPAVVSSAVVGGLVAAAVMGGAAGSSQQMIQTAALSRPAVCEQASQVENASDASVPTSVATTDVARQVAKALSDEKVTRVMAAGVMGNLYGESNMDPKVNENGGGGFGLGQWTPKSKVRAWFDSHGLNGVPDTDAAGQTRMVVEGTVASRSGWINETYISRARQDITVVDNDLYTTFVTAPDIRTATLAYMYGYERPAAWALRKEDRLNAANGYDRTLLGSLPWGSSYAGATAAPTGGSTPDASASATQAACVSSSADLNTPVADSEKVNAYLKWAFDTAADDSHGYSETRRFANPDYDCSSFVWYALHDGAKIQGMGSAPWNTQGMHATLGGLGFQNLGRLDPKDLKTGDILLDPVNHTEIFTKPGKSIGAHKPYGHPEPGDQTGKEVAEGYLWTGYLEVWRYTGAQAA
ncbi:phage tail tip lysozyme [Bifidobacterium thermophilum]|uniref:phage tail tip lysozyme n=1 Tax=Bifidobacterium thermophilum TaxID=33905 RepID=UPI003F8F983B